MSENWQIGATPRFTKASCPKHGNPMLELEDGWFGNPKWWCKECKAVYKLEFRKMKTWNEEAVDQQVKAHTEKINRLRKTQ